MDNDANIRLDKTCKANDCRIFLSEKERSTMKHNVSTYLCILLMIREKSAHVYTRLNI